MDLLDGQPRAIVLDSNEKTISNPDLTSSRTDGKYDKVRRACDDKDVEALSALATSPGGLLSDDLRQRAWPILLGCRLAKHEDAWSSLPIHKDEDQVKLDVNRSFVYYPNNESPKQLDKRKQELSDIITEVLRRHPQLCYFQGFHDIVQVILLVLGPERASDAVARISLLRIRDFMLHSMAATEPHLRLLPAILSTADATIYHRVKNTDPFYALSATLTLYAHEIEDYGDIARLFDFIIAHEAVISLYLFAAMILSRKEEILDIPEDEPDILLFTLSKLPRPLDLEGLIARAMALFQHHPPRSLPMRAWNKVSPDSVLKTTQDIHARVGQTLEEGELLFKRQEAHLRRQESIEKALKRVRATAWVCRRPAAGIMVAVAVGFIAYSLRPGPSSNGSVAAVASWILRFLGGK